MFVLIWDQQEGIVLEPSPVFAQIPSRSEQELPEKRVFIVRVHAEYFGLSYPLILMKALSINIFERLQNSCFFFCLFLNPGNWQFLWFVLSCSFLCCFKTMQEVTSGDTAEVSKEIDATHTLPRNAVEVKGNENTVFAI